MTVMFSVRNLTVRFSGRLALDDVSLDIPAAGVTALVGRSGSGKSTFLRALNRLNEEVAPCTTSGAVLLALDGAPAQPIYRLRREELPLLRRCVGMVFQTPELLPASILRNITLPLMLTGSCDAAEAEARAVAALQECALWAEVADRLNAPAAQLSGGQRQRLCLARALALEPAVLLLDEPTAALDVHAAAQIEELLLRTAERLPLVLVSHAPAQALRLAARVHVFAGGKIYISLPDTEKVSALELAAHIAGVA